MEPPSFQLPEYTTDNSVLQTFYTLLLMCKVTRHFGLLCTVGFPLVVVSVMNVAKHIVVEPCSVDSDERVA